MQIDVVVRGDRQTVDLLDKLTGRLEDGRPQFLSLVSKLNEVHRDRFDGKGVRWKKLSAATKARDKRADKRGPRDERINVGPTRRLMDSLTQPGHPKQVVRIYPDRLVFGTSVFYAKFAKSNRRNPVGASRDAKQDLTDRLKRLLLEDLT